MFLTPWQIVKYSEIYFVGLLFKSSLCKASCILNTHTQLILRKMYLTTWLLSGVSTLSLQSPSLCCAMPQIQQVDNTCSATECYKYVQVRSTCCVTDYSQSTERGDTCYAGESVRYRQLESLMGCLVFWLLIKHTQSGADYPTSGQIAHNVSLLLKDNSRDVLKKQGKRMK